MEQNNQPKVYNNFHELWLVFCSFGTLAIYLHTGLSNTKLSHWVFFALLTALAIFNWAMLFNPYPKKGEVKPFWSYAKTYGFCCFLWFLTFVLVGWKTVLSLDFIGILTTILCLLLCIAMFYGGSFFLWASRVKYLIQFDIRDTDNQSDNKNDIPWNITLKPVQNFTKPRYVYADGSETEEPTQKNSKIIGFRIGSSLVLHSVTVSYGFKQSDVKKLQAKIGGKLLNSDDVKILRQYWDEVSEMYKKTGHQSLPNAMFWYQKGECVEATHRNADMEGQNPEYCAVIMKL